MIDFAVEAAARAIAENNQLIDEEGWLHCWVCGTICNWHVSLHCDPCREASHERIAQRKADDARAAAETERFCSLGRSISDNPRLSRDNAQRMLNEYAQRPAATNARRDELQRRFDARFDKPKPGPRRWSNDSGPGFRRSGDD